MKRDNWIEMSSPQRERWIAYWSRVTRAKTPAELIAAMKLLERASRPNR